MADDVLMMVDDGFRFQTMLTVGDEYSQDHDYTIHPVKSTFTHQIGANRASPDTRYMLGSQPITVT